MSNNVVGAMITMDKLLINGGKKEVKLRNRAMVAAVTFVTGVLGISDLAHIVATYMFGSVANIPIDVPELLMDGELGDVSISDGIYTITLKRRDNYFRIWSIVRMLNIDGSMQLDTESDPSIEFDDMMNFVLFGRSAVISKCVASCGYDRDVAGQIVSRIYDEIFARYRKIDDISSDSE